MEAPPFSTCVVLDHWKDGGGEADTAVPFSLTLAFWRRSEVEHSIPLWQVPGYETNREPRWARRGLIRRPLRAATAVHHPPPPTFPGVWRGNLEPCATLSA